MGRRWPLNVLLFVICYSLFLQSPSAQHAAHVIPTVPQSLLERAVPIRSGIGVVHDDAGTKSQEAQAFYDQGLAYLHSFVWI
ncbi:MAG TPA: hypothetical protein VJ828_03390 [Lacipirellulaceae bacterium]|nr:hypothetical protein [Lacipirellulaceae bacterium]